MHCIRIWGTRIQGGLHIFSYTKHIGLMYFKNLRDPGIGLPNSWITAYTWGLQFPFAFLFCGVTPYGLMKSGFAEKQFSSSEQLFFRTCLDCFQSTQNLYVDRNGNLKPWIFRLWKIVFSHWRGQARHCKKKDRDLKNCFFGTALVKLSDKPDFAKKRKSGSTKLFFSHASC